uniref:Uncharacterized protein n=1 Tax=Branchiostoma floridae TaxID=7739 RepID=C3YG31_BRAFL|eukprot:XP_002604826.1 hypothetical protein BRAFLDRAFT_70676 [Branchiostoma floridae]
MARTGRTVRRETRSFLRSTSKGIRILEWVDGNVSLITVHPAPQFPFGTERGTTVIGYYATFDCSSWTFPGSLLKQVVTRSKAQLREVVGGEVIGDPVLFIRGLSNQRAMNREYFLGMGALSLLALLLLCAGWQGNGDEVKELQDVLLTAYCACTDNIKVAVGRQNV